MTPPTPPGQIPFPENSFTAAEWADKARIYALELERHKKIVTYLGDMVNYKANAEARIAYGLPPDPLPIAPEGYTPPAPAPVVRPPAPSTVVREPVPDVQYGVIYPAPGDPNPADAKIDNPFKSGTEEICKVVKQTPFGAAHFWVDVV